MCQAAGVSVQRSCGMNQCGWSQDRAEIEGSWREGDGEPGVMRLN